MKIVYSLWSKPRVMSADHRVCLALSVLMARQHYDTVEMVTDSPGARLLERMGLEFSALRTDLDDLDVPPAAWAAGKLVAYLRQEKPFIHVDHDVFLFRPLPERITSARLAAQSFEDRALYRKAMGHLPADLLSRLVLPEDKWGAYNAGILGGTDVGLLQEYAARALYAIRTAGPVHPVTMTVFEQAFFARAAAEAGVKVETLLEHDEDADDAGYCHLMCAKQRPDCMARVRRRLEELNRVQYTRAILAGS